MEIVRTIVTPVRIAIIIAGMIIPYDIGVG